MKKKSDLAFARFHEFPWWPVRILSELAPGKKIFGIHVWW